MGLKECSEFVEQSFADQQLSRSEAAVFRQLLEESKLDSHQRALLRNKIFDCAKTEIRHPQDREVLEWISDLIRLIDSTYSANASSQSLFHEALFFPSDDSLKRLLHYIDGAKQTLDVCVYTITDDRITRTLIAAHERGVAVRIISDDEKAADLGSDIVRLSSAGIPFCVDDSPDHMHHKFAVIDRKILINGSFNWTRSASTRNQENVVITNQPDLIRAFIDEFETLWQTFRRR